MSDSKKSRSARFATWIANKTGSTAAFMLALSVIVAWAATGPIFKFSDTWQLVINTGTTIITFLMVFLIQHAQNRESLAVQLKLNEIVAAIEGASNRLVSVEDLSDEDLDVLHAHYRKLASMAKEESRIVESHSVDEAKVRHQKKHARRHSR
jgi:low affinity Fe/Cu permease